MTVHSKWDITHTTKDYRKIGHLEDLYQKVVTSKGIQCEFTPISKGLHVLQVNDNTDGCFFRRSILDNTTDFGIAICNTILSESMEEEDDLITNNRNLVGVLHTNSFDSSDRIADVIRGNTAEVNDKEDIRSIGVDVNRNEIPDRVDDK